MQPVVFDPAGLRVGQGYDVHAFAEGRRLILGGVDIPHVRGLLGHSDADVLAHAISDALLGGIRGGDIGKLFPDTDPAFKDADSLKLLAAVADKVRAEGYVILDVDSVIAAQAPKLSPYREAMRENLAAAMGIAVENVGVKATTTEHLGFEGREEGISATAVCILFRRSDEQRRLADAAGFRSASAWRSKLSSRACARFVGLSRQSETLRKPSLTLVDRRAP